MLAKRVSGISGKDVEEREGSGKRGCGMWYLCKCQGNALMEQKRQVRIVSECSK